jgi:lipopolysaccharide transport system permease protein
LKDKEFDLIIEAGKTEKLYFKDLWKYRELFVFFAWRDIIVRYKQTIIGVLWAVLRPFLTMVVFTIVFGKLANMKSEGAPYAILVLCGMLPWQFFSSSVSESSNSLIANANMISKIYFPRIVIPTSSVIVSFIDFLISFIILGILMVYYKFLPDSKIFILPVFIFMGFMASMGIGLWIAALNVKYRDFRYVVPFIIQFGLYISPVGFSSSIIPDMWRNLYYINPMVGVIDGFRWCIIGEPSNLYINGIIISLIVVAFLVVAGLSYFRKTEKTFADVI